MSWQEILGHRPIIEQLTRAAARRRLASAYLFVGPSGIGKRRTALKFAQALLCSEADSSSLEPCGRCSSCVQVAAGSHADLQIVSRPRDRSFIPVELFIGDAEHRMHEGLCHWIGLKPFLGGRKIAIIDDADYLNEEGANCLLKTLEEPPPASLIILIGTSAERQLPTIRSRCQTLRFQPLEPADLARVLLEQQLVSDEAEARRLAAIGEGSVEQAMLLAGAELWSFRRDLIDQLAAGLGDSLRTARAVGAFVDEAGKEAAPRRTRLRQVIGMTVEFYRQGLRQLAGGMPSDDNELARALEAAIRSGRIDVDRAAACLERSLEALGQVDRNANQGTLIECWIDDLGRILAGQYLGTTGG